MQSLEQFELVAVAAGARFGLRSLVEAVTDGQNWLAKDSKFAFQCPTVVRSVKPEGLWAGSGGRYRGR